MMRNILHLFRRDFGRADIHTAVYLHGIGADDFAVDRLGQTNGKGGFPHSSGAGENNERFFLRFHNRYSLLPV